LIGAGGAGKAIAFALARLGVSDLQIFDCDHAKATHLAARLTGQIKAGAVESVEDAMRGAVGLINSSPVGMSPDTNLPVPASLLHAGLWVADAVYSPLWTPLLVAAKATGATVMTGRELAIYQAVDAFELFTGLTPSSIEMGIAFDGVMAKRCITPSAA
jgi:shikimate dehydrogenase